jgi:hypothetical protein
MTLIRQLCSNSKCKVPHLYLQKYDTGAVPPAMDVSRDGANRPGQTRCLGSLLKGTGMDLLTIIFNSPAYLVLVLLVLLHEPSNRRAVRLVRAWKNPRGK